MIKLKPSFLPFLVATMLLGIDVHAQENTTSTDPTPLITYQLRTGVNIGGFSPLPIPEEIRGISSFNPKLNMTIEGIATYWFSDTPKSWGIRSGIRLENKGMKANSTVKNYGMEIIGEGGERVAGNWTGGVSTSISNSYITIPVSGTYKFSKQWEVSLGAYASMLIDKDFSGYVFDGYLREGGPTGDKVIFEDGKTASYNFSNDLRRFAYGFQVGGIYQVYKNVNIFSELSFGLNDVFKSDFKTITFSMRPIYLNLGAGYLF